MLVTGLSGAGKASILRVLEDLGFETVDNPPLKVLEELVEDGMDPIAAGIDTRTRGFVPAQALATLDRLRANPAVCVSLVYATAEDAVLLRRFTETRRRHPLAPGGSLGNRVIDGIEREKDLLSPLQDAADLVIDTSELPLPTLRTMIEARFRPEGMPGLAIQLVSFAFPRGLPREADLVFDVRFLRNPHYVPGLQPQTGRDAAVADYVETDPGFRGFWARLTGFVDPLLPRYVAEGKKYLTIALGCTGGKHRSVLVAERLAAHLRDAGWRAEVSHRELARRALAGDDPAALPAPRNPAAAADPGPAGGESAPTPLDRAGGREALTRIP
ncbi:RNase adapter RapZ [Paracraurococcus ruber]|uniref:RNase adaptor protein RapZ n=1 Tax=Paracraurococcus ruber TaxID=77675 RepID=A0ABS1D5N8_9PROT|nr:RNase adaptor protein RapZ [Paracraurococcus ruber]TDG25764.1 RNase adapter RapZ [Paracraurococcus ruber]